MCFTPASANRLKHFVAQHRSYFRIFSPERFSVVGSFMVIINHFASSVDPLIPDISGGTFSKQKERLARLRRATAEHIVSLKPFVSGLVTLTVHICVVCTDSGHTRLVFSQINVLIT